ncbi:MAG TPA: LacI family DNA-binding transcriptional regulator [Kineosporiaceae bacterium]
MPAVSPAPAGSRPTTIARIAQETGVSITTVSKVLNGRSDVAPATRARVEASLERHDYRRRYRREPTGLRQIDLVFHLLAPMWGMEIIRGVEAVTAAERVDLVLSQLDGGHRSTQQWLDGVLGRRPLGVLLVASNLSQAERRTLENRSIPFVIVDKDGATPLSAPTVGSNNGNGGYLATRHLLDLGHRRVGIVSGPTALLSSRARLAGYRSAHDEAGLPVDPELVRYGTFHAEAGYRQGLELLDRPDRPTALFAGSDMQALGLLRAARELGLEVPRDLSVVGYDDVPLAAWTGPALTTIRQPLREMAGAATRMLLDLSRGVEPESRRIELATEIVIRESSAPPS